MSVPICKGFARPEVGDVAFCSFRGDYSSPSLFVGNLCVGHSLSVVEDDFIEVRLSLSDCGFSSSASIGSLWRLLPPVFGSDDSRYRCEEVSVFS